MTRHRTLLTPSAPNTFKVGLTPEEKRLYSQLFKTLDPESSGVITGEKARVSFEKSGLPPAVLGEIWQLADRKNLGFLTQFGFCYAMRLIGHAQAGQSPSAALADTPGPLPRFSGLVPGSLQPQSTSNSFMQSQPSAQVPQNTATFQTSPQEPIATVSPADYQKFTDLFIRTTGSPTNELVGSLARDIFLKAKLPTATLGQIWNLVDTENLGKLNIQAFVVAMHLIQGVLSGTIKQLPPFLPDSIWQSAQGNAGQTVVPGSRQSSYASVNSHQTVRHVPTQPPQYAQATGNTGAIGSTADDEWVITPTLKQQYDSIFTNLDKQHAGKLNPDQVALFLMTSKLNQQDLATVWDLSDIQNTGVFTKVEFAIALFLVNKKLAGTPLPNVVPTPLLTSIQALENSPKSPTTTTSDLSGVRNQVPPPLQPATQSFAQPQAPPPRQVATSKSSIDDLADVFGSPTTSPAPVNTSAIPAPSQGIQPNPSSSDLSGELPRVRKTLTGGFKPTSDFGQKILHQEPTKTISEHPDLLGEDVATSPAKAQFQASPQVTSPESNSPVPQTSQPKTVNYEALRSVPPPPKKTATKEVYQAPPVQAVERGFSSDSFNSRSSPAPAPAPAANQGLTNNDLLADPATSGQLSQATSDIANISNQVKSLSTQTTDLHDKKGRAEQELAKILNLKKEIESKLRVLKTSYENEVKLYKEVEGNLGQAKEEAEALRSESSISEAKLNSLSSELNERQVTMENLQKDNSAVKEKLGTINAEISELEKQTSSVASENQRLVNQLSVKKSQVQVVLVKKQELEAHLAETHASNKKLQEEINRQAEEERQALQAHQNLQQEISNAKSFVPTKPKHKTDSSASKGIIGAAVGAAAGIAGAAIGTKAISGHTETPEASSHETEVPEVTQEPVVQDKDVSPEIEEDNAKDTTISGDKENTTSPVETPGSFDKVFSAPVEALVDEVKDKPSASITGIDDVEKNEVATPQTPLSAIQESPSSERGIDEESSTRDDEFANSATGASGFDNETPITTPSNSEYQFPQGGLAGIPGVLVGVQRTDSLTSSVQNNASMSVRDDNIEDVSDRDTIGNNDLEASHESIEGETGKGEQSDGDKPSSGVESFEIVNAEDAKEAREAEQASGGHTFVVKNPADVNASPNIDEEFPPIKELDYDESDSSSDDEDFHEAKDLSRGEIAVPPAAPVADAGDDFDNAFNDLEPAQQEVTEKAPQSQKGEDFFGDEFDDLEAAQDENVADDFTNNTEEFFNNDFTNSNMPDFAEQPAAPLLQAVTGNDEWEQLFAGFGNSASQQDTPAQEPIPSFSSTAAPQVDSSNELVQELVGMGFDEKTATAALEKEHWDLEAATNYLLDNA